MAGIEYIFVIACLAAGVNAAPDSIANALELDATCTDDSPSCNLQLLQVKDQKGKAAQVGGYKPTEAPADLQCNVTVMRYNFARPDTFPPPMVCFEGAAQSPIDISTLRVQGGSPDAIAVKFDPIPTPRVANTGHNLQVNLPYADSTLVVDGATYYLAQFHIHMNGEHQVNLRPAACEIHFVFSYTSPDGMDQRNAVVGIFFDISLDPFFKGNPLIQEMVNAIPPEGCSLPVGPINIAETFKEELAGPFWSYNGSLTTPGCTENVRWQVMKRRAQLSWSQYTAFKKGAYWFPANNRPVQPVNGRIIFLNNADGKGANPLAESEMRFQSVPATSSKHTTWKSLGAAAVEHREDLVADSS